MVEIPVPAKISAPNTSKPFNASNALKEELANAIANDIALMEQLINAKQEYNKVRNELASIAEEYKVILGKLHNEHEKIVEQEEKEIKE